jgi:hypothetical protein
MPDEIDRRLDVVKRRLAERGLEMKPPLAEAEVAAFEKRAGVRLPDDYRRFLIIVGNGGAGPPEYGLEALGQVPSDYHRKAEHVVRQLALPFIYTERWIWEDDDPSEDALGAVDRGTLVLGTDGCGLYWTLIVTGAARGQVWSQADVGISPCEPPREFLGWFEDWLEGLERDA